MLFYEALEAGDSQSAGVLAEVPPVPRTDINMDSFRVESSYRYFDLLTLCPADYRPRYHLPRHGNQGVFLSSASLKLVTQAQVFHDAETSFCKGILLDYQNGGQQALGECRLGLDPAQVYHQPTRLVLIIEDGKHPELGHQVERCRLVFGHRRLKRDSSYWNWQHCRLKKHVLEFHIHPRGDMTAKILRRNPNF